MATKMKALDRKFHIQVDDLNIRIVKTSNGEAIPDDEPLILFRARDYLALWALHKYRQWCVEDHCTEYQIDKLGQVIQDFALFANTHPQRMKQPGCTRGA